MAQRTSPPAPPMTSSRSGPDLLRWLVVLLGSSCAGQPGLCLQSELRLADSSKPAAGLCRACLVQHSHAIKVCGCWVGPLGAWLSASRTTQQHQLVSCACARSVCTGAAMPEQGLCDWRPTTGLWPGTHTQAAPAGVQGGQGHDHAAGLQHQAGPGRLERGPGAHQPGAVHGPGPRLQRADHQRDRPGGQGPRGARLQVRTRDPASAHACTCPARQRGSPWAAPAQPAR